MSGYGTVYNCTTRGRGVRSGCPISWILELLHFVMFSIPNDHSIVSYDTSQSCIFGRLIALAQATNGRQERKKEIMVRVRGAMGCSFALCCFLYGVLGVLVDSFHLHKPATAANRQVRFPCFGVDAQEGGTNHKIVMSRNEFLGGTISSAVSLLVVNAELVHASTEGTGAVRTFNDPTHGFSIQVPSNWVESSRILPDRRKIQLWTNPTDPRVLLFVAYTPIRDDFTSISSFGSVEQVAAQTILPKGPLAGVDDVVSEMLSTRSAKQAYYFDYTQLVPNVQPLTHFRAIFALQQGATGGAGAVLVTVTAQAPEEVYKDVQPTFDRIIDSFGKSS